MSSSVPSECSVCIEKYSKNERSALKMVQCSSCEYHACKQCVKTYLLGSTNEPHCMNCRKRWDRDLQYELLGSSFINGEYRKHRKTVLFNNEIAQLPATQYYVDASIEQEGYEKKAKELASIKSDMRKDINRIAKAKWHIRRELMYCNSIHKSGLKQRYEKLKEERRQYKYKMPSIVEEIDLYQQKILECRLKKNGVNKTKKTESNGIKCPQDGCRGYVTGKQCNICSNYLCRKCLVLIDTEDELKEHECDKETLETAQLIMKESKGCPSCGTRISKVSGCDQMWCPQCEVAFSWRTGERVNGVIHNPHFYEYARRRQNNGNGNVMRNPGDRVCGGLIDNTTFISAISKLHLPETVETANNISDAHRSVGHLQHVIDNIRRKLNGGTNNIEARAKYMRNIMTEKQFTQHIIRRENEREKLQSLHHIYESYVTIATERINGIVDEIWGLHDTSEIHNRVLNTVNELMSLRNYINEQLHRVRDNYNVVVECFHERRPFEVGKSC